MGSGKEKPNLYSVCHLFVAAFIVTFLGGCDRFVSSFHDEASDTRTFWTGKHNRDPRRFSATGVYTYHDDLARTGLNATEKILTTENVNSQTFGKVFTDPVDGYVYAQPLYAPGVLVPGSGYHNIVFVATENDSVYAFDADEGGNPLWHASLLDGGTPVPADDFHCDQILPQVGITSTPVIDPATGTLYAVAMVKHNTADGPSYSHEIHALDIATGAEKFGSPTKISGSVAGIGEGQVRGTVAFDPFTHLNRPGLALANGVLYVAFGSHCDMNWFHGWVFAYNAGAGSDPKGAPGSETTPVSLRAIYNTTPDGYWGSIWQAGGAPAIDSEGDIFVVSGNGTFRGAHGVDYSDTVLKLNLHGDSLRVADSFTPYDRKTLDEQDIDLGSSGPILLPDQSGPHPHLLVTVGKSGAIYVVDRDRMGRFQPGAKDGQIVQVIRGALASHLATPAYWEGHIYFGGINDTLKAFSLTSGRLSAAAVSQSAGVFAYPGTSPTISSDGPKNGIVWALQNDDHYRSGSTVLHAYDATDLSHELYHSGAQGSRDAAGPAVKFTSPTIAGGKVYVGTQNSLDVFGLLQ